MQSTNEQLLSGPLAVEQVSGNRPSYSTYFRWTNRGLLASHGARVRLEYTKAGNVRLTSVAAVQRFFKALSVPPSVESRATQIAPTASDHQQAIEQLDSAGI